MAEKRDRSEYFKEYRKKNAEKLAAYQREYRRKNPDKLAYYYLNYYIRKAIERDEGSEQTED